MIIINFQFTQKLKRMFKQILHKNYNHFKEKLISKHFQWLVLKLHSATAFQIEPPPSNKQQWQQLAANKPKKINSITSATIFYALTDEIKVSSITNRPQPENLTLLWNNCREILITYKGNNFSALFINCRTNLRLNFCIWKKNIVQQTTTFVSLLNCFCAANNQC